MTRRARLRDSAARQVATALERLAIMLRDLRRFQANGRALTPASRADVLRTLRWTAQTRAALARLDGDAVWREPAPLEDAVARALADLEAGRRAA